MYFFELENICDIVVKQEASTYKWC